MNDDQLQEFYEKYKHYQSSVINTLNLKDLINLIRTVDISKGDVNEPAQET